MPPTSSTRRSLLAWGLPLLLILVLALWFSRHGQAPQPAVKASAPTRSDPAIPVRLATVQQRDMPIRLQGVGHVQAWASVTVQARIDGQLEKLGFTEGEDVRAGQLIAQLDDRVQKAQLDQALAQEASNRASLRNAQADLRRYEVLAKRDAVTGQVLDTQKAQVAQLQAALLADAAQVAAARAQLSYTRIMAPIGGRTGARLVDPGNIVRANSTEGIVVINQIDPIAVTLSVPDTAFGQVSQALQAGATLRADAMESGTGRVLGQGEVVLVDNRIDPQSGTLQLKARFDNAQQRLWPGQYVDVRLILGMRPDALVIPERAVQRGPDGLLVYVVDAQGVAGLRPVEVITSQDGLAVVAKGLQAGEQVVTDGQYKLRPGSRTTVMAEPAAPAAAAAGAQAGTAQATVADPEAAPLAGADTAPVAGGAAGAAGAVPAGAGDASAGQGGLQAVPAQPAAGAASPAGEPGAAGQGKP